MDEKEILELIREYLEKEIGDLTCVIIPRHDTSSNWSLNDPTLANGEYGVETDTHRVKRGDGVSEWSDLPYETFGIENLVETVASQIKYDNSVSGYEEEDVQSIIDRILDMLGDAIRDIATKEAKSNKASTIKGTSDVLYPSVKAVVEYVTAAIDGVSTNLDGVKQELETKIANNKTELETALADTKAELEKAIEDNTGKDKEAIERLEASDVAIRQEIADNKTLIDANTAEIEKVRAEVVEKETALNAKITENTNAIETNRVAIEESKDLIVQHKEELDTEIADTKLALELEIKETKSKLETDMNNLSISLNTELDETETELKELISKVETDAKTDLDNVKAEIEADIDTLETELTSKIDANTTAINENKEAIETAKTELNETIEDTKTEIENEIYAVTAVVEKNSEDIATNKETIEANKAELVEKIETAETTLNEKIDTTKSELTTELEKVRTEIEEGSAATTEELNVKIEANTDAIAENKAAIETNKADIEAKLDTTKTELETSIANAKTELEASIDSVKTEAQTNLENTKTELETSIADTKSTLETTIAETETKLTADLEAAKSEINTSIDNVIADLEATKDAELDKDFTDNLVNKLSNKDLVGSELLSLEVTNINPADRTTAVETIKVVSTDNTIVATKGTDGVIDIKANLDVDVNYFVTTETLKTEIPAENVIGIDTLTSTDKKEVELQDIITDPEGTWARVQSIDKEANTITCITFHKHAVATWGTIKGNISEQQDLQEQFNTKLDKTEFETYKSETATGLDDIETEIADNKASIEKNAQDIATNTQAIADNKIAIESNDADIETLNTKVAENTEDISNNAAAIAQNITDIATNKSNIEANGVAIEENKSAIEENASAIAENKASIETLNTNVATNTTDIADLDTRVVGNTTAIADNKASIEKNVEDIASNKTAIEENKVAIANNGVAIEKNAQDILLNKTLIETNKSDIAALKVNTATNRDDITKNTIDIANNKTAIEKNTSDIALNKNSIEVNTADISAIKTNIISIQENIDANEIAIEENKSNIETNKSNITANAEAIASNKAEIDTNTASIETLNNELDALEVVVGNNTNAIEENALEIEANAKAIEDLNNNKIDKTTIPYYVTTSVKPGEELTTFTEATDEDGWYNNVKFNYVINDLETHKSTLPTEPEINSEDGALKFNKLGAYGKGINVKVNAEKIEVDVQDSGLKNSQVAPLIRELKALDDEKVTITKFNELETEVSGIVTNADGLKTEIDANAAAIEVNKTDIATNKSDIETNKLAIEDNDKDIANLQEVKLDKEFTNSLVKDLTMGTISNNEIAKLNVSSISPVDGSVANKTFDLKSTDNTLVSKAILDESGNVVGYDLATNLDVDVHYFVTSAKLNTEIPSETVVARYTITATTSEEIEVNDIITDAEGTWARIQSIDTVNDTVTCITFHKHAQAVWGTIKGTMSEQKDLQEALDKKFGTENFYFVDKLGLENGSTVGITPRIYSNQKHYNYNTDTQADYKQSIVFDSLTGSVKYDYKLTSETTPEENGTSGTIYVDVEAEKITFDAKDSGLSSKLVNQAIRELKGLVDARLTTKDFEDYKSETAETIQDIKDDITVAKSDIVNLQTKLNETAEQVETNTTAIADNKTAIETNKTNIETLDTKVSEQAVSIEALEALVPTIEGDAQGLVEVSEKVVINTQDIEANKEAIAENKENIEANSIEIAGLQNVVDTKVDKVEEANKVYGTDENGEQVTYNVSDFGAVKTVNGLEADENKNIEVTAADISYDLTTYTPEFVGQAEKVQEQLDLIMSNLDYLLNLAYYTQRVWNLDLMYEDEDYLNHMIDIQEGDFFSATSDNGVVLMGKIVDADIAGAINPEDYTTAYKFLKAMVESNGVNLVGIAEQCTDINPKVFVKFEGDEILQGYINEGSNPARIILIVNDKETAEEEEITVDIVKGQSEYEIAITERQQPTSLVLHRQSPTTGNYGNYGDYYYDEPVVDTTKHTTTYTLKYTEPQV